MKSSLFERIALSKDKAGVLKLAKEGHIVENPFPTFLSFYASY
jgi:hypothetical protein